MPVHDDSCQRQLDAETKLTLTSLQLYWRMRQTEWYYPRAPAAGYRQCPKSRSAPIRFGPQYLRNGTQQSVVEVLYADILSPRFQSHLPSLLPRMHLGVLFLSYSRPFPWMK